MDQLLNKAGSIYDQKDRTALYQQAAQIMIDDSPFIPMYVGNAIVGMGNKVRNYVQYADSYDRPKAVWLAP